METYAFSNAMNNTMTLRNRGTQFILAVIFIVAAPWLVAESPGTNHIAVPLADPSRPARVEAHLVNGSITVKAYDGKEVIVDAKVRSGHGDEEELWSVVQSLQERKLLPADAAGQDGEAEVPALAVIRPAERPGRAPVDLRCKELAECSPRQVEYFLRFAGGQVADTRRALRVCPR